MRSYVSVSLPPLELQFPPFFAARMPKRRTKPKPLPPPSPTSTPPPLTAPQKQTPNSTTAISNPRSRRSLFPSSSSSSFAAWEHLSIPVSELSLTLTLPTGQTFLWRRTSPSVFTGPLGPHLISLRHHGSALSFLLHNPSSSSSHATARTALQDFLNLEISLGELWREFAEKDERFAELARRFGGGARVLRQNPMECLFQFLCSSNNNIRRIEKMVGVISSFGEYLGTVGDFDFYQFPTLERLSAVSEQELRDAGFGYRAKYIVGTIKALQVKPDGGAQWLASLRGLELPEVIDALCTLPGVGPKVAACIALFSLDQHHAIPVDTHVWRIANRYLMPELVGKNLTPKLCSTVADAFVTKFGRYAGWAQNVLFIGELPSQKLLGDAVAETKPAKRKRMDKIVAASLDIG